MANHFTFREAMLVLSRNVIRIANTYSGLIISQSYWISQIPNDVEAVFKSLQRFGNKVLRIWGFNMVESTLAEPLNPDLTFYQLWINGTWYLNTGSNGLERFDQVVKMAEKYDVKL